MGRRVVGLRKEALQEVLVRLQVQMLLVRLGWAHCVMGVVVEKNAAGLSGFVGWSFVLPLARLAEGWRCHWRRSLRLEHFADSP